MCFVIKAHDIQNTLLHIPFYCWLNEVYDTARELNIN